MNHQKAFRKLGRNPAHRRATLRNLATALVINERVETTLPKAKELKRVADKLVTLGKKGSLHSRRQALSYLMPVNRKKDGKADKTTAVHRLFEEIAPRYEGRAGGYTRVIRGRKSPEGKRIDGRRDGDGAELAVIEFVQEEVAKKPAKKKRRATKRVKEAAPAEAKEEVKEEVAEEVSAADSDEQAAAPEPEQEVAEEPAAEEEASDESKE